MAFVRSSRTTLLLLCIIAGALTSFVFLFALEKCPDSSERTYKIIGCFAQILIGAGMLRDFWGSRNDIERYQPEDNDQPKKKRRFKMPALKKKKKVKTQMHYRLRGPWILLSPICGMFMLVYMFIDATKCQHVAMLPISDVLMFVLWAANLYVAWHSTPFIDEAVKKRLDDGHRQKGGGEGALGAELAQSSSTAAV